MNFRNGVLQVLFRTTKEGVEVAIKRLKDEVGLDRCAHLLSEPLTRER